MTRTLTGQELYERFNEYIQFDRAANYGELPRLYRDAWEALAEYAEDQVMYVKKKSIGGK